MTIEQGDEGNEWMCADTAEIRFSAVQSLNFESAVTAQNDEFTGSFDSSTSSSLIVKT